ncbi:MAG TPA: nitrate reductase molybdenum cofactor assembly chaperone [Desulfobacterales bacterium]
MRSESTTSEHDRRKAAAPPKPDPAGLKLISYLLQYPDEAFLAELPDLKAVIDRWPDASVRRNLRPFCEYLMETPPLKVQEAYTAAFDLNPETCLNLTYHRWGDDEKRGRVLARLMEIYIQAGYECDSSELPDHLALVLEFCSRQPHWIDDGLFDAILEVPGSLAKRLSALESPYARVVEGAVQILISAAVVPAETKAACPNDPSESSS